MLAPHECMLSHVDTTKLVAAIDRVRASQSGELKTNYFFNELRRTEFPLWMASRSLAFLDREHTFERLYFVSADLNELTAITRTIPDRLLVTDYLTGNNDHSEIDDALDAAGFQKLGVYQRMSHKNLSARRAVAKVVCAEPHESDPLFDQLCQNFDVRVDRIPERDDFAALVRKRQVLVHRERGEIDAYLIYQLQGRRAKWDYWYSRPNSHPAVAVSLLSCFFADMAARSINRAFLWVRTEKRPEMGLYERLGFQADGLMRHAYARGPWGLDTNRDKATGRKGSSSAPEHQ